MKRSILVVVPIAVAMSVGLAAAQDHLVCYRMKDPLRLRAAAPTWLDLTGPQFGSEQCKIVGGFRLFCVPVDKTVTAPIERKIAPAPYEAFTPNPEPGLGEQDRLCYKIKCTTNAAPSSLIVEDQFATRSIAAPKPYLVCGPAEKFLTSTTSLPPVPTTSTSSSTATSTTSTTSTTQPPCCVAGGFLSLTTTQTNFGADAGDLTRADGTPFPAHPNLALGGLYLGGGGASVAQPQTLPDMGQLITQITSLGGGCAATLGPTTSTATGSNRSCTAAGCLFGAPLPVPNAGSTPTSFCGVSQVAGGGASGTSDCCTGAIDVNLSLSTAVYLTGDTATDPAGTIAGIQPCPLCSAGTCIGGPNNGMACTAATTALNNSYPTSHDCPPDPMFLVNTITLTPTLTTGTVSWTGTPATNDTGLTVAAQTRVFCGYCRNINIGQFQSPAQKCWQNGMAVGPACTGSFDECEQRSNGAFGPGGGNVKTITALGVPSGGICSPAPAHLATVQCVPPTYDITIDASFDLPGPAASVVDVTTQFCPVANPCP
jgi:hypothetical protein